MKQVLIDNLKGKEILALPVLSESGTVLIHADVELNEDLISKVKRMGVASLYIQDPTGEESETEESKKSESREEYKEAVKVYKVDETAADSREIVQHILEKHIYKHNDELKQICKEADRIMDSVMSEPEVINNITEIRNVSTDMYTHCINVCALSTIMALRLKMSEKQVHNVSMGAILHDIGLRYINVPYINRSEEDMSEKELTEYKKHTIFGYSSLQEESWLPDVAKEIILLHHERVDGRGYPFHHKGDRLKAEVKLVSLCDDFDALISGIGKEKMKIYEAIEYIKVNAGEKYDSTIANKLLESVAAYPVGCVVFTDKGERALVIRQNREMADRPVIKMLTHADGSPYTDNVEYNLMRQLTMFIVDTE